MAIVITELLGTDSMSGSRFTINANFNSVKSEIESIETVFGLSLTSGNIDVSGATGGVIKGKTGAFNTINMPANGTPVISLTSSTGIIVAPILSIGTSITTPILNIQASGGLNNLGTSTFALGATFNSTVKLLNGLIFGKIDMGVISAHTVLNDDRVIIFEVGSPSILALTPDTGLFDGHVITFIKKGTGTCTLDPTNIEGFGTGSITFATAAYKSAITLMWNTATSKWIIIGSNNMTIV